MRKSFKRKGIAVAAVLTALILVAGLICKPVSVRASDVNVYTSYNYLPVGSYDSADTAILQSVDTEERTVTFYNTTAARNYTLNYDGTTYVSDRYGTPMSIEQLTEGTIVRVNFYKSTRQLVDIQVSPDAWSYESITRYDLGGINSTASIGDRTYALTKGVQVFSQGKQTDLMSIVDGDAITVAGIDSDIYSIKVESGHGYVRLTSDEALIGGWIEIGGVLITQVTEPGMLLTVPEGTYTVQMYNNNSSTTKLINVERNQEIVLDCSEITAPVDTFGRILFHVTPASATLTMDGVAVDHSNIVRTEYGIHEIVVSATGYDTLSRYINVGNELSEITINLDQSVAYTSGNSSANSTTNTDPSGLAKAASGNSVTAASSNTNNKNSVSSNKSKASTVTTSKTNRVYVNAPEGAEVYVDGLYAGLIPMSFKKSAGAHTVILKRSGCETRSYTIYVFDDGEDMSISFSELTSLNTDSSSSTEGDTSDETDSSDDTGGKSGGSKEKDETVTGTEGEETGDDTTKTGDETVDTGENTTETDDESDKKEDEEATETGGDNGKTEGEETGDENMDDANSETGTTNHEEVYITRNP